MALVQVTPLMSLQVVLQSRPVSHGNKSGGGGGRSYVCLHEEVLCLPRLGEDHIVD